MKLDEIQNAIREFGLDGWLFYDFQNRDGIGYRILGLDYGKFTSRRWYYFIPAYGEPRKLVHMVEAFKLDALPGEKNVYLPWSEQHEKLKQLLGGSRRIAMQYSPGNAIPYISLVDGGTIELIRSFGVEIVSSADLVQLFEAIVTPAGFETHLEAGRKVHSIMDATFREVARRSKAGEEFTENDIQRYILECYDRDGLVCDNEFPIVAVNAHSADPHFEPLPEKADSIHQGDFLLLDIWARLNKPGAIFYDITWTGFLGAEIPEKQREVFAIVRDARDAAVEFTRARFEKGEEVRGWEVDDECRRHIVQTGYGPRFIHRTGHSIGTKVHGNGVHIDNLETKDERRLVPGILFSVEPGIYLAGEFGVRSELDCFIGHDGKVKVTGPVQKELFNILEY